MKTLLFAVLVLALIAPAAQSQIIRSDSATFKPATTWDSVSVMQIGTSYGRSVMIHVSHLSGTSVFAVAAENDTAANSYKRLYFYPGADQWMVPFRAKFIRRRAIGGDSCNVQTMILVR